MDYKEGNEGGNKRGNASERLDYIGEDLEEEDREIQVKEAIEIVEAKLSKISIEIDQIVISGCLTTIHNMLHEEFGDEIINHLVETSFFDVLFFKMNAYGASTKSIILSLMIINTVFSKTEKNTFKNFPRDEYLIFLLNRLKNSDSDQAYGFIWRSLGILIKYDKECLNKVIEQCCIEELQKIIKNKYIPLIGKKAIYQIGSEEEDFHYFEDGECEDEDEDRAHERLTLENTWMSAIIFFLDVTELIFVNMNNDSKLFYINVFMLGLSILHIHGAVGNSLKGLIFASQVSPELVISSFHSPNNRAAVKSLFFTAKDYDQGLIELAAKLIYILIDFAPNCFDLNSVIKFVYSIIQSFGWSEVTGQFKWATKIIGRISFIKEALPLIVQEDFLLDIDQKIGEVIFDIKRLLVVMLCHILEDCTDELRERIIVVYNIVESICETTSLMESDDKDSDIIVIGIAEIIRRFEVSGWNIIPKDDFSELVNSDFIEDKSGSDSNSAEAANYIISVFQGDDESD